MRHQACVGFFLALALNGALVWAVPGFTFGNIRFGNDNIFDNDYENVNSKIYNIITGITSKRGQCTKHVRATGNGVGDMFEIPCSSNGVVTITSDKVMIYGNPEVDSLTLFSDEPSTLVVYQDGKCIKRTYKTVTRQTYAETSDLSDEDCKNLKNKVAYIVEEESKYLDVLDKHVDESKSQNKKNGLNQQDYNQGGTPTYSLTGTSSEPQKPYETPLGKYNQPQDASQDNLKTLAVSHQEIGNTGVTVTEQASRPSSNVPGPVAQSVAEAADGQQVSRPIGNVPGSVAQSVAEAADGQQVSWRTGNVPGPMAQSVAEAAALLAHSVPEAAAPLAHPVAEATDPGSQSAPEAADGQHVSAGSDQTSGSHPSFFDRLSATYSQIKSQVSNHVHNPSGNGWDLSNINNLVHSYQI